MISVSADEIAAIVRDDREDILRRLQHFSDLHERMSLLFDALPAIISGRSPFFSQEHIYSVTREETERGLRLLVAGFDFDCAGNC